MIHQKRNVDRFARRKKIFAATLRLLVFIVFCLAGVRKQSGDHGLVGLAHAAREQERRDGGSLAASIKKKASLPVKKDTKTWRSIMKKAAQNGLGGGLPGALAGVLQVLTLMWLRTISNYQYRYGTTFRQTFQRLYREGGWPRMYRGLSFALGQAPLSRFVSTAANDGVQSVLESLDLTKVWGAAGSTLFGSIVVGLWRMLLMPVDTCKTVLQVDSVEGFRSLIRRVKAGNIGVLYEGAFAQALAAMLGHYPWFFTYNVLKSKEWIRSLIPWSLVRHASIGLLASVVSDTATNFIRVIKTTKQAVGAKHALSYIDAVKMVVAADGWKGLFGRGLKTKLVANALQSVLFTVLWRGFAERWGRGEESGRQDVSGKDDRQSSAK